jgi:hypothetical protein
LTAYKSSTDATTKRMGGSQKRSVNDTTVVRVPSSANIVLIPIRRLFGYQLRNAVHAKSKHPTKIGNQIVNAKPAGVTRRLLDISEICLPHSKRLGK